MATYLVTQATGQQSQWVITHLLAAGLKVHGVVRDLEKVPAALKNPSITLFQGESTNLDDIFRAAQGCKGAFLNTFPIPGLEGQQARIIVAACEKAGVENIVAATTFFTGNREMWDDSTTREVGLYDYFNSKAEVEDAVRGANFRTYTILRPAFINVDYLLPSSTHNFPMLSTHGVLDHSYEDYGRMPHTDAHDVGKYAVAAFLDPAKFGGQEIDLSNDAPTVEEARDIVAKVSGRAIGIKKRTPAEMEEIKETFFTQRFHLWVNAKTEALSNTPAIAKEVQAKFGIPFTSLEMSLQRDKARLLESLPAQ
jgi:uncharacterized protein YbjT (DUF2867 family)